MSVLEDIGIDASASLDNDLSVGQCPVCSEQITEPKQLSACSHTFCKKCLKNILSCSLQSTTLVCRYPDCGKTTIVKDGNLDNLKTNFPLKALIEDLRKSEQLCKKCDSKTKATHFCYECGKNMCNTCLEGHNKWLERHRVWSVNDIREGKVVIKTDVFCQEHKGDLCTDVCLTCMKFICARCRKVDHEDKGHIVQDLEEYKSSIKKKIESQQARGEIKAATIKNHQNYVEVQKKRVNDYIDRKITEIDLIQSESIRKIKERWAALGKQLEAQRVKLCERLVEMTVANERMVMSIESASVLAVDSLKAPLKGCTIKIRGSLSDGLEDVLKKDDPSEKLATDVGDRAEQLIFQQNSERDQLGIGEVRFQTCILECDVPFSKKDDMNVMAATPDGRMAIGFCSGGIGIYSAEGKLQEEVLMDVWVRKVAFLADGRYVVRQRGVEDTTTYTMYTRGQKRLEVAFETLGQDDDFTDLTVDRNDMIYISYRKAKKIQVFSPEGGKAIREIPCIGYEPVQITSHNDLLIVTGMKNVRMVNKDGQVKHRLQKSRFQPFAAVTLNNSVLVAWVRDNERTMSIDEYSNELGHIRRVISDQTIFIDKPARCLYYLNVFPSGEIAFCSPDRLYIFN